MNNPRIAALRWLTQVVVHSRSVNDILAQDKIPAQDKQVLPSSQALPQPLPPQQRALAKQLLFGCLRYYFQLKTIADNLLEKPFKAKDTDLLLVIILGLYQLKYLATPDHAAISESVELTRSLHKQWARGLVNGVLRRFQRESIEIENKLAKSLQFKYAHPGWIVKKLKHDWPDDYQQILAGNNQQAPMILRVNTLKNSRSEYQQKLLNAGLSAKSHELAPDALVLDKATDVIGLPGFTEGEVTVQDAAAQLVVEMLDLQPKQLVLDACAAPGGKTTHILQRQNQVQLTAVEMSSTRADRIRQTLNRLDLDCRIVCSDINDTENWWDGVLFDRILLDVPCSASGVIRRNPDIKIHRKVTDIKPLVEIQARILRQSWQLLKPGGILVYATCSVFKDENQEQLVDFIDQHKVEICNLPAPLHQALNNRATIGYQILPGEKQMDGFYFCGMKKCQ